MTTIDTITDEQILQLRAEAIRAGDFTLVSICNVALTSSSDSDVRVARAECARVIGEATRTAEATDWRETVIGETITDEQIQDYHTAAGAAGDLAAVAVCEVALDSIAVAQTSADPFFTFGRSQLFQDDSLDWLAACEPKTIHGVVTDPPYGLVEYTKKELAKLRKGKGGVWRIPPAFDGHQRSPLPRFTTLSKRDLRVLDDFFGAWARVLFPALVPGAHVVIASNPLLSHRIAGVVERAGYERRGEIIRLVMTLRGGDRPKNAHEEFQDVSVMPRSMWEPWLLFRKPIEGRVQDNLRRWGTGGLRRPDNGKPFGDVIESHPTRKTERELAPHPSLKPQSFMRQMVRAILPMGEGIVLDPFAGSGSTLAAAEAVGYASIGVEKDKKYARLAKKAVPKLATLVLPEFGDAICVQGGSAGAAGDLEAVAVYEVALDSIGADPDADDAYAQAVEDAVCEHDQESARAEVARMYRDAWAAEQ